MPKLLDQTRTSDIEVAVLEVIEDAGYSAEEGIPGLVQAIVTLAGLTSDELQALDEAGDLLADAGVEV